MANEKRLIERNFAERHFAILAKRYQGSFTGEAFERAAKEIAEMPGVDAVEVVRCKNCENYEEVLGIDSGKPAGYGRCQNPGQWITGIVYDDDFCSYGERKDNVR